MAPRRLNHGFTLIEMVVTVGIFSVVAVVSYAGFERYIQTRDAVLEQQKTLMQLSSTHTFLNNDLARVLLHPERLADGSRKPQPVSINSDGELLNLASLAPDYRTSATGKAKRINYVLTEDTLLRKQFEALDPFNTDEGAELVLLEKVANIQIEPVLLKPNLNSDTDFSAEAPILIRFTILLTNQQTFEWLFELPRVKSLDLSDD